MIQEQFAAHRKLDRGNPSHENLKDDFNRFGFTLNLTADPANGPRLAYLLALNIWRNAAAHQGRVVPAAIPQNLPSLQVCRTACDGLASSLDAIMYNQLRKILRRSPW